MRPRLYDVVCGRPAYPTPPRENTNELGACVLPRSEILGGFTSCEPTRPSWKEVCVDAFSLSLMLVACSPSCFSSVESLAVIWSERAGAGLFWLTHMRF